MEISGPAFQQKMLTILRFDLRLLARICNLRNTQPDPSIPLASIVVVCLNQVEMSRQCLTGLFAQDYPNFEVIVVDNGSTDDVEGMVGREFPNARFVRLPANLGFAGGYNRGMQAARGEYVAIINNDALADPQWLREMVKAAEADDSIGLVAPRIIDGNDPKILDSFGVAMALDGMSRQRMRGSSQPPATPVEEVLLASGCACLFRSEALKVAGYFDEDFFAYCEDSDLGLRLAWAGFRTLAVADALVYHHYSKTTGKFNAKKVFWVERNHYWLALKNFPFLLLCLVPLVTIYRYLVQVFVVLLRLGDLSGFIDAPGGGGNVIRAISQAHLSFWAGVPCMLKKRRQIQTTARRTGGEMTRLIWRHRMSIFEVLVGNGKNGR